MMMQADISRRSNLSCYFSNHRTINIKFSSIFSVNLFIIETRK